MYIVESIAISLDCVSKDVTVVSTIGLPVGLTVGSTVGLTVGSKVGSTVGLTVGSTWLCWAINLSKAFDSSDERRNNLVV
jgi:hypothetical protein